MGLEKIVQCAKANGKENCRGPKADAIGEGGKNIGAELKFLRKSDEEIRNDPEGKEIPELAAMDREPRNAIAAEGCNQSHEQSSGGKAPRESHQKVPSERFLDRYAVVEELAALHSGHDPGRNQHLDERL